MKEQSPLPIPKRPPQAAVTVVENTSVVDKTENTTMIAQDYRGFYEHLKRISQSAVIQQTIKYVELPHENASDLMRSIQGLMGELPEYVCDVYKVEKRGVGETDIDSNEKLMETLCRALNDMFLDYIFLKLTCVPTEVMNAYMKGRLVSKDYEWITKKSKDFYSKYRTEPDVKYFEMLSEGLNFMADYEPGIKLLDYLKSMRIQITNWGEAERALKYYKNFLTKQIEPSKVLMNNILECLSKRQDFYYETFDILQQMEVFQLQPEQETMENLIRASAYSGDQETCLRYFNLFLKNRKQGFSPTKKTFVNVMIGLNGPFRQNHLEKKKKEDEKEEKEDDYFNLINPVYPSDFMNTTRLEADLKKRNIWGLASTDYKKDYSETLEKKFTRIYKGYPETSTFAPLINNTKKLFKFTKEEPIPKEFTVTRLKSTIKVENPNVPIFDPILTPRKITDHDDLLKTADYLFNLAQQFGFSISTPFLNELLRLHMNLKTDKVKEIFFKSFSKYRLKRNTTTLDLIINYSLMTRDLDLAVSAKKSHEVEYGILSDESFILFCNVLAVTGNFETVLDQVKARREQTPHIYHLYDFKYVLAACRRFGRIDIIDELKKLTKTDTRNPDCYSAIYKKRSEMIYPLMDKVYGKMTKTGRRHHPPFKRHVKYPLYCNEFSKGRH
ncbi:hypothetical protein O9G_004405 [Rozella allomycis CSF55]|uniref:Uncharacterized protein n=1 Tax=Rozella allomycis (strain CSF55) TaxID=988480 RepID=A0A075AUV7_ROZAC|nr:hypothetical protein O9G_004405 [Rozella allomycis CSF55]|eukprot:EPZ32497.1 hypothetical protein O9G_004405 [Rozella allomycis CSF55]